MLSGFTFYDLKILILYSSKHLLHLAHHDTIATIHITRTDTDFFAQRMP